MCDLRCHYIQHNDNQHIEPNCSNQHSVITLNVIRLCYLCLVSHLHSYAECHSAECHSAECHSAECRYTESRGTVIHLILYHLIFFVTQIIEYNKFAASY